jgi:mycothiol synthase
VITTDAAPSSLVGSGAAIVLPGTQPGADLRFRRWGDASDLDAYVALVNGSWQVDGVEIRTGAANEANDLTHLTDFDLERDLVLVERAGHLVAFARVNIETEDDGTRRHWSSIMCAPDARGSGLETTLLDWAEARHRERAAAEPPAQRRFGVWAAEREAWWVSFLESRGYRPARWFTDMVRATLDDLPDRPLPEGLQIRPVRPEHIRTILAAEDEAFRDHWGHHPMSEEDIVGLLEHPHTDPSLWAVAWDGDEVAALVSGAILHDDNAAFGLRRGWLGAVATRRPWRNRGLASALIVRAMDQMRARGLTSVALGVDTENLSGALGLYERLGFRTDQRFLILYRPFDEA